MHAMRDPGAPIFVDTSGLYAVLDAGDVFHDRAGKAWRTWVDQDVPLVPTNHVVLEATALLRNRLRIDAATSLHRAMLPMLQARIKPQITGLRPTIPRISLFLIRVIREIRGSIRASIRGSIRGPGNPPPNAVYWTP